MDDSYLERSYLNLDSESERSLRTWHSRIPRSQRDEDRRGTSRTIFGEDIGGDGLSAKIREKISDIPRYKIYIALVLVVILVLGGVGGGVAAGVLARRNNARDDFSHDDSAPSNQASTFTQASSSTISRSPQSLTLANSSVTSIARTTSPQASSSVSSTITPTSSHISTQLSSSKSLGRPFTTIPNPGCTDGPVPVTFRNAVQTKPGERVKVIGNVTALGNWNPALALTLCEQTFGDINLWSAVVFLTSGQVVMYEFIVEDANGTHFWQDDWFLTTTVSGACTITTANSVATHSPTAFITSTYY